MAARPVIAFTALAAVLAHPSARAADPAPSPAVEVPAIHISKQLDAARSRLEPSLGATIYKLSRDTIETIPQGDNAPLNQVLEQAPGVAQDSFGQIHVRGDHNEIQFRLDGVQLPEGLTVFGQALETRFAHSLSLITGALPAQYGYDTAAVIDITTKTGITDPGGEISLYGGARDYFQPSFQYGAQVGSFDIFATGDFVHDRVGIENPTSNFNADHDLSNQTHGLIHLSDILDDTTRLSLLLGASNEFYQIPNNPDQTPSLGLNDNGITNFDSASLDEHQREITDFGILSLQKQIGPVGLQTEILDRYSSLYYSPDPIGDLLFNGIAQTASRSVLSTGEQTDIVWDAAPAHTVRAGFQLLGERNVSSTDSTVLPALGADTDLTTSGAGLASAKAWPPPRRARPTSPSTSTRASARPAAFTASMSRTSGASCATSPSTPAPASTSSTNTPTRTRSARASTWSGRPRHPPRCTAATRATSSPRRSSSWASPRSTRSRAPAPPRRSRPTPRSRPSATTTTTPA